MTERPNVVQIGDQLIVGVVRQRRGAVRASVALIGEEFVANLSDGRRVRRSDFLELAEALYQAGVRAEGVTFDWNTEHRLITAGQKVAICAEMRRREVETRNSGVTKVA